MTTKNEIKIYAREILQDRTRFEYTTEKDDLLKRIQKKFNKIDLMDFEEVIKELLQDGEIYEVFPREFKWLG